MSIRTLIRFICFALVFSFIPFPVAAENFTNAVRAFLQQRLDSEKVNAGIVVGLIDEHGSRVISCGKLDNGTDREVDGDTMFEIGSDTKTFTALLLQDMAQRGKMKLDDPVSKYLPASVKMPTHGGRTITLRHLGTHTSGLPAIPDNLDPKRADNPYADYTVEKLYAFLSGYKLTRAPGAKSAYSNLGMGLLGHVIALKSGSDYESLVVDRICRPLKMDSTRITLTPELKSRLAISHNLFGEPTPSWDVPVLSGAGAFRSTANDLLKYVSANLGLTPSSLTPLMKRTHEHGFAWFVDTTKPGSKIISHGGGTGGSQSFVGFDIVRRRGVVVLFNARRVIDVERIGQSLLRNEWKSDGKPVAARLAHQVPKLLKPPAPLKFDTNLLDAIVGEYVFPPDPGMPSSSALKLTIWREADQLIGQISGEDALQGAFNIYPESENNFVIKINGAHLLFTKNDQGQVTRVIHREPGVPDFTGRKIRKAR